MKKAFIYICLFCCSVSVMAKGLSPEAEKMKTAYELLLKQPNFIENQLFFVTYFPGDKNTFIKVFDGDPYDQLYGSSQAYIDTLKNIGLRFPGVVLPKIITIGKQLVGDPMASRYLQQALVSIAAAHTIAFVKEVMKLSYKEEKALVSFLADRVDINSESEYQQLITNLQQTNNLRLAESLTKARDKRLKQQN